MSLQVAVSAIPMSTTLSFVESMSLQVAASAIPMSTTLSFVESMSLQVAASAIPMSTTLCFIKQMYRSMASNPCSAIADGGYWRGLSRMFKALQVAASLVMLRGNWDMLFPARRSILRGRSQRASGIKECPQ